VGTWDLEEKGEKGRKPAKIMTMAHECSYLLTLLMVNSREEWLGRMDLQILEDCDEPSRGCRFNLHPCNVIVELEF